MAAAPRGRAPVSQLLACPDARLQELVRRHGSDAAAQAYLEELRWPDGVSCVRCSSHRVGFLATRQKHQCRDCGYQFRVSAGTVLHDSHVPPARWLVAVHLMLGADEGFPANQLHAVIGGSYKTAWFVEHRIRAAMAQALGRAGGPEPVALAASAPLGRAPADAVAGAVAASPAIVRGVRLLKRTAGAAYRRPSLEHLGAYWAELRWREAHAGTDAFRLTLLALLEADPVSYRQLTRHPRPPVAPAE